MKYNLIVDDSIEEIFETLSEAIEIGLICHALRGKEFHIISQQCGLIVYRINQSTVDGITQQSF